MDRTPLRGMVLNALILLYGYCQGWGVAFGRKGPYGPGTPNDAPQAWTPLESQPSF